jgi:hypothetical protein
MRYAKIMGVMIMAVAGSATAATFGEDVAFLKKHVDVVVLQDGEARVAVVPAYQGRVMVSSAAGDGGQSHGWINREAIASGEVQPHINVYGGADRFWLGPEGGQFSIFFKKGDPFDLDHWQTPPLIDTEPFEVTSTSDREVVFSREATLTNYSGTTFTFRIDRTIRLIDPKVFEEPFDLDLPKDARVVAYESENTVTNTGDTAWKKDSGLLSIWILGMFNPAPGTTVMIPFNAGDEDDLGPVVNDAYFGKVPEDRLQVSEEMILFSGDGEHRSKIGLSPQRAKDVLASIDVTNDVLTVVHYNKPENTTDYVNSMWEHQEKPYAGDVVNAYNDGPPAPGKPPLGPFYELETSSPALALKPGEGYTHFHRTLHVENASDVLEADAIEVEAEEE